MFEARLRMPGLGMAPGICKVLSAITIIAGIVIPNAMVLYFDSTHIVLFQKLYFVSLVVASWAFGRLGGTVVAVITSALSSFVIVDQTQRATQWGAFLITLPVMLFVVLAVSFLNDKRREVSELNRELERSSFDVIKGLAAALETTDSYTKGHSDRVARFALGIGKAIRLSEKQLETLERAARLHDIGKIGVERAILTKPSRLSVEEYELVKEHPGKGAAILENVGFLVGTVPAVRHHHERYDGSGYPDGLKGEEIPLLARILAIADSFDAMTSTRPYRRAMSVPQAVQELKRNSGTSFDPKLVEIFVGLLDEWGFETDEGQFIFTWELPAKSGASEGEARNKAVRVDNGKPSSGGDSQSEASVERVID